MFGLGYGEMMVFGVIAVLLFGSRLPQVARSMGRSLTEFKKGMQDLQTDMSDAMHSEPAGNVGYDSGAVDDSGPVDYHQESGGHESGEQEPEDQESSTPKFRPPTSPPTVDSESVESKAAATETS